MSEQVSLDNNSLGGGAINEIVGSTPSLIIPTLDKNYSHIKIYAIKYTSYNQNPSVSLIEDTIIDSFINYRFSDDGNNISDLTLSEFILLGSNPLIPKHIESKDNRLFSANIKDTAYTLDIDMRAYSHDEFGNCKLFSGNIFYANGILQKGDGGSDELFTTSIPVSDYIYLRRASIAKTPVAPNRSFIKIIGLLLGLILGIVFIILRYLTHSKIISVSEIESNCNANILGIVPKFNAEMEHSQIVVTENPKSSISEAFRAVRTNLEFLKNNEDSKF